MYQPAHFDEARPAVLQRMMREHPLALVLTHDRDGLHADPLPLLHEAGSGGTPHGVLRGHVARANPLWRRLGEDAEVLVVFQGPHAYVSPNWYPTKAEHGRVVPTWNYCIVQARGAMRAIEDRSWLRALVGALTDRHEADMLRPWAVADAPGDFVEPMLGAIVGIELPIRQLVGKWKVSQNRSPADRAGVAVGLDAVGGDRAAAMAAEVRDPGRSGGA